ncbi:hypothetical protein JNB11_02825 [Kocuria palustris]|nr:hypothetical protein [Kocuria palustris]
MYKTPVKGHKSTKLWLKLHRKLHKFVGLYSALRKLYRLYKTLPRDEKAKVLRYRHLILLRYFRPTNQLQWNGKIDSTTNYEPTDETMRVAVENTTYPIPPALGQDSTVKQEQAPTAALVKQYIDIMEDIPEEDEEWVDPLNEDWDLIRVALSESASVRLYMRRWDRKRLHSLVGGYEIIYRDENILSVDRLNATTLFSLVHISIMRKEWKTAYMAFALLSRMSRVDWRRLWPMGMEILQQLKMLLVEAQYANWLERFISGLRFVQNYSLTPESLTWEGASKKLAGSFVVARLWRLVLHGKYSQCLERLESLMVTEPYLLSGVCYCIRATALIGKCASTLDPDAAEIMIELIERDIKEARKYDYYIPPEFFAEQLQNLSIVNVELVNRVQAAVSLPDLDSEAESIGDTTANGQNLEESRNQQDFDNEDWSIIADDDETPVVEPTNDDIAGDDGGDEGWGDIPDDEDDEGEIVAGSTNFDDEWGDIEDDNESADEHGDERDQEAQQGTQNDDWGDIEDDEEAEDIAPNDDDGWGDIPDDDSDDD